MALMTHLRGQAIASKTCCLVVGLGAELAAATTIAKWLRCANLSSQIIEPTGGCLMSRCRYVSGAHLSTNHWLQFPQVTQFVVWPLEQMMDLLQFVETFGICDANLLKKFHGKLETRAWRLRLLTLDVSRKLEQKAAR